MVHFSEHEIGYLSLQALLMDFYLTAGENADVVYDLRSSILLNVDH